MAKGVLVHRPDSPYDDFPEERYQFPKRYLKRVEATKGDWIVYYEPKKGGRHGYSAVAKIGNVVPDHTKQDMYRAYIEPGSYLEFENFLEPKDASGFRESELENPDGSLNKGRIQWAVRPLSDLDFARIIRDAFDEEDNWALLEGPQDSEPVWKELDDAPQADWPDFRRDRVIQTGTRLSRDRVFRKLVLNAYDCRCALTGSRFINGGGRAEVEAAHIRPVANDGPDTIRNGIALSGTAHWMFDRGLVSLTDGYDILVSRQANDPDAIWRLMRPSRKALVPDRSRDRPHPHYLAWHRENCFKG